MLSTIIETTSSRRLFICSVSFTSSACSCKNHIYLFFFCMSYRWQVRYTYIYLFLSSILRYFLNALFHVLRKFSSLFMVNFYSFSFFFFLTSSWYVLWTLGKKSCSFHFQSFRLIYPLTLPFLTVVLILCSTLLLSTSHPLYVTLETVYNSYILHQYKI